MIQQVNLETLYFYERRQKEHILFNFTQASHPTIPLEFKWLASKTFIRHIHFIFRNCLIKNCKNQDAKTCTG